MKVVDYDGRKRHEHFSHETDASEFAFVIRRRRERHTAGLELIPEPVLFSDWVETWLERRRKVRPASTWTIEEGRLRRVWLRRFRRRKLWSIQASEIAAVLDRLIEDGSSNATRNRHRAMLHRIFEEARRSSPPLVSCNPVTSIPILDERWRSIERVVFSEAELIEYCRAARHVSWLYRHGGPRGRVNVGRSWQYLAELMAWSLLRPTEALALTIGDFEKMQIAVEKIYCKTEKRIVRRTKGQRAGGGYRSLLLPRLRRVAKALRRTLPPEGLVGGGMTYDQALDFHRVTLQVAGLPRCGLRVFRHSMARLLKTRGGFAAHEIQELLGHESLTATARYTRTCISHLAERGNRLELGRKPRRKRN